MFGLFKKKERPEERQAMALYDEVVAAARIPRFYSDLSVPDDVDGRFEMICLHAAMVMFRLEEIASPSAVDLSQALFDRMFLDMDRSLREMGISDLAVPKHMKRMLNGFNGRAHVYREALKDVDGAGLKEALKRNVYGTLEGVEETHVQDMAAYVARQWAHVRGQSLESFQNSENVFIKG